MVKSFITFYFIQYHKDEFRDELLLCIYLILQMELYFSGLVKISSKSQTWIAYKGLLIKKGVYLEKKQLVKNVPLVKQIFNS